MQHAGNRRPIGRMTFLAGLFAVAGVCGIGPEGGPAAACAQDMPLTQVLIPGEEWQLVSEGHRFTEAPVADAAGNVYFVDVPESKIFRVDLEGKVTLFAENTQRASGLAFGPDGRLYACQNGGRTVGWYDAQGRFTPLAEGFAGNDLAVTPQGRIYVTDPQNRQVWLIEPNGRKQVVARHLGPNGIIAWARGETLVVTERDEPWLWTFRIRPDGSLDARSPYYAPWVIPPGMERPGSDGMTIDRDGRLYVTTAAGLQMFDPTGRLGGVIARPHPQKGISNVCFGGPEHRHLYVTSVDQVYRRLVKPRGVVPYRQDR